MFGRAVVVVSVALALSACGARPPPRPEVILPPDDVARPIPGAGIPPGEPAAGAPNASLPPATGDRELDGLRVGFHGCRLMGLRIAPAMSGAAVLEARLGPGGEVLDVQPLAVTGLPRTVVTCLVERVYNQRFDPRGGYGSVLRIPVDFTRESAKPTPTRGEPAATPTRAL